MGDPIAAMEPRKHNDDAPVYDAFLSYSHSADDLLAPRLQGGLQTFAKPWWRRRAIRVFRDDASLSANPHLWSSIAEALDQSEWFIPLLSPEAAQSEWVNREVEHWLAYRSGDRILPVVTDGELIWDKTAGRFDPSPSSAVPPAMLDAFADEPRWVDLRWAREETQLDLRNSRFRAAVADIASAVRGIPKDELESEEVRQQRRLVRTAWAGGIALTILTVASIGAAFYASDQRQEADTQRQTAEKQTELAIANEARAEDEASRAGSAEQLARSRELAASAINVIDEDPELSILLSLSALDLVPGDQALPVESVSALREAVHNNTILQRVRVADDGYVWLALSNDGSRLLLAPEVTGVARMVDTETSETLWEYSDPESIDTIEAGEFSLDGRWVTISYIDSTSPFAGYLPDEGAPEDDGLPSRLLILDAESGEVVARLEYPDCPTSVNGAFSPDGRWLAHLTGTDAADGWCNAWQADIIDTSNWTTIKSIPLQDYSFLNWTPDGNLVHDQTGDVIDIDSGERVAGPVERVYGASVSPDGSLMAGVGVEGIGIYEMETGRRVDRLLGLDSVPIGLVHSADGRLIIAPTDGAETVAWDASTGEVLHRLPVTGPTAEIAYDSERGRLYHAGTDGELTVWDLSGATQGELGSFTTGREVDWNTLVVSGGSGSFREIQDGQSYARHVIFEEESVRLSEPLRAGFPPALLPDGRLLAIAAEGSRSTELTVGPVVAWDPATGAIEEIVGCQGDIALIESGEPEVPCADRSGTFVYYHRPFTDIAGARVAITSPSSIQIGTIPIGAGRDEIVVLDANTLDEVDRLKVPGLGGMLAFEGDWAVIVLGSQVQAIDMEDATPLLELGSAVVGFEPPSVKIAPDGRLLAVGTENGHVEVYDTTRWESVVSIPGAHNGHVLGLAFTADGSRLMTSGSEGFVKVWEIANGQEAVRIPLDGVADGHWLDDDHIVVATNTGLWTTLTLDLAELQDLARSRLTRGFTADECAVYRIDPCPET